MGRVVLIPLFTLACADAQLPVDQAPLPQPMTLTVTTPLTAGGPVDLRVAGARPGATIKVIRSDGGIGGGACPAFLSGQCLDIRPGASGYVVQNSLVADAAGVATFAGVVPARVPGGTVASFQAVDVANRLGSNPVVRTIASQCADDAREDDDNFILATQLTPSAWLPSQSCPGDDDWYYADLSPGQVLDAAADFDARDLDLDLYLLDARGNRLMDSRFRFTSPERLTFTAPTQGRYYLTAHPAHAATAAGAAYILRAAIATPLSCAPDTLEPNNDGRTQARTLGTGSWSALTTCTTTDYDWFQIPLDAGQSIVADLLFDNAEGDIDAWLLALPTPNDVGQINSRALVRATTAADDEHLAWTSATAANYWLAVHMYRDQGAGRVGNTYDLTIDVH
ncbi:MAG TPA: hypothetical protein PKA64_02720 [Myxococcota bacterium]|nr:hypothetical protein [Myxococcota bacterium]